MAERLALDPAGVWLRHIVRASPATPGAVNVIGSWFAPVVHRGDVYDGLNGRQGWQSGSYERRQGEDGTFTVTLPNGPGADGVLHRERFRLLSDPDYRPGEEWLEVYLGGPGKLLFVGTPVDYKISRTVMQISGPDGGPLLKKSRSGQLEFWAHSPRDVFTHYTGSNVVAEAARFADASEPAFTYSTSVQTTSDGRFSYQHAYSVADYGVVLALDANPSSTAPRISTAGTFDLDADASWEVSASVDLSLAGEQRRYARLFAGANVELIVGQAVALVVGPYDVSVSRQADGIVDVRIVNHLGWLFGYVDGQLIGVLPSSSTGMGPGVVGVSTGAGVASANFASPVVRSLVVREHRGFLGRGTAKGDLRLPGAPTPGGLRGRYFQEAELRTLSLSGTLTAVQARTKMLAPTAEPYASRLDATIDFPTADPPAWRPSGSDGAWFSARWTGSIYLDLAASDRRVYIQANDRAVVYIGRTRLSERYATSNGLDIGGPNLRALLGPVSGWFPIRIEYQQTTGPGGLTLKDVPVDAAGNPVGTPAIVPTSRLSPQGCLENMVRLESHRDMLDQVTEAFGHQWTCEPRQLESGEFPGQIVPRIRQGRDTSLVVEQIDAYGYEAQGSAEDTLDTLLADAAGIADADGAQQLTAEATDHAVARRHLLEHVDYASLSDISEPEMLAQRQRSMLALRSSPFEQVTAQPYGIRQLVDSFPLTGTLALFDWAPGDGVRLDLPEIAVRDLSPRQTLSVAWPIRPHGRGGPTVGFRQRPRSLRDLIQRMQRETRVAQRNYQGTISTITSNHAAAPATAAIPDAAARLPLPADVGDVISCDLIVTARYGDPTTPWTVTVNNGASGPLVNGPVRVPITSLIKRDETGTRMFVILTGGTGRVEYCIEARVRI